MNLKTLATGSTGNCYILTSDNGKHLILDAGIPIKEIKKGLEFDVENIEGCICTHVHLDHSKSIPDLQNMGIKVWQPYLDTEHKRIRTRLGEFEVECFDVPHGVECRAFLITINETKILYASDFEYIGYDLSSQNINVMLIELNYQKDRITEMDEHRRHTVLGHAEEQTTIEIIKHNMKHLRTVVLCHMSMSGALDRELAMQHMRSVIPDYIDIQYAKSRLEVNLNECPF